MRENRFRPPAYLSAIIRPNPLSPITVATGLRGEQMKQGLSVSWIARGDTRLQYPLIKKRADFFHRSEHRFVTFHPRDAIGPTAALDMEAMVLFPQFLNHFRQPLRPIPGLERLRIGARTDGKS